MKVEQLPQSQSQKVLTVGDAVNYLEGLRLPATFAGATRYLRSLWHSANLLSLYHHYFPQEFTASGASASLRIGNDERSSSHRSTELYSPKEVEFLHLVDQKLFSIYLDYYLEGEEREEYIYIPNYGPDWWSYEWDDLHGGWQILLLLIGCVERGSLNNVEDCHYEEVEAAFATVKGHNLDWEKLRTKCLTKSEPITYLPLAFEMIDHDTGNIFLDPTDESPAQDLEWSIEDMNLLIQHYEEAKDSLEKADKLLDWLTTSPAHLQEVIELWNECLDSPTTDN